MNNQSKTLYLPWKGRILTPTFNQLRKFGGNLDSIMMNLGSIEPVGAQKQWTQLRIKWKGETLLPSPNQLFQSGGDLNRLKEIIHAQTLHSNGNSFQSREAFEYPRNY